MVAFNRSTLAAASGSSLRFDAAGFRRADGLRFDVAIVSAARGKRAVYQPSGITNNLVRL